MQFVIQRWGSLLALLLLCFQWGMGQDGEERSQTGEAEELGGLLRRATSFNRVDNDSVFHYGQKLYLRARALKNAHYEAGGANMMGLAYGERGQQDSAIHYLEIAFQGYLGTDSARAAVMVAEELSRRYMQQGRNKLALERLNSAMVFADSTQDSNAMAKVNHRLCNIYLELERYDLALETGRRSLEINRGRKFDLGVSVNLLFLGNIHRGMGNLDSAEYFMNESRMVKERIQDEKGLGHVLVNLGLIETDRGNYARADSFYQVAERIARATKVRVLLGIIAVNRGYNYRLAGSYEEAIAVLEEAMVMPEVVSNIVYAMEGHHNLAFSLAKVGRHAEAFAHLTTYNMLKDSMSAEAVATQIIGMEAEIEERRQERQIALLNAEAENRKALIWMLGGVVLVVLAFTGLLLVRYRIRSRDHARLNVLNQLKSRFFGNIAHEFKTPLSLILGPLDKLMAASDPGSEERVLYALMQRNARQLLDLNNQLLDLARLEAGRMELRTRELSWERTLRDTVTAFGPAAERREVELRVSIPASQWEVQGDRSAMEKILNNLLSNAVKNTPGGGWISFEAELVPLKPLEGNGSVWVDGMATLRVRDSGKGIPKEDLDRIFDRFYQVESARMAGTPGTGIGLALVRDLVQLMDGEIGVESVLGEGSSFVLRLPMRMRAGSGEAATPMDELALGQETTSGSDLPRLLVVEDNDEMREYMRREFAVAFEVAVAENGRVGLEMAIDDTPDLVISDLMMPEMDGIALCSALRASATTSHVPFILLTALGTVEDRVRGLEEGADDYIQKPFHMGELMARARNLIEQRRQLRRLWGQVVTEDTTEEVVAPVKLNRLDEEFLERAMGVVRDHMADPEFSVESFSREMHMSRPQLFRKIKALTDQNLSEFIRTVRLKEAGRLFGENFGNVTEVLYAVGFNNSSYFSKCFREMYGVAPSDYAEQFRLRSRG